MKQLRAEIIAIGDELTSGARLDTNTQWVCQQLNDLGIQSAFHTTVGDDLNDHVLALNQAIQRADIVISTGGLGPTADDLTRQALARAAGVELEFKLHIWEKIQGIFLARGRQAPESNKSQAYFPIGSNIIDNPEGTAPGIDRTVVRPDGSTCRIIALPGVPSEMKRMWQASVTGALRSFAGQTQFIRHRVLHCFGQGESQIEAMLPDLIRRGREPRVGITASAATISLRITATADSPEHCFEQMRPTIELIRQRLGNLVFGQDDDTLQHVVSEQLKQRNQTLALMEMGTSGQVAHCIAECDPSGRVLVGSLLLSASAVWQWLASNSKSIDVAECAQQVRQQFESDIGLAIGPGNHSESNSVQTSSMEIAIAEHGAIAVHRLNIAAPPSLRPVRSAKQVLNQLRLHLLGADAGS